jgi:hypothetical protein
MFRRIRFRYSLGSLLIFVSVITLGFWYWWQRPFEVEVVIRDRETSPPPFHVDAWPDGDPFLIGAEFDPFESTSLVSYFRREVRTVRRDGLSGMVRDGRTLVFNEGGRRIFEEDWSNGRLHGVYRMWSADGYLLLDGRFEHGLKHGRWSEWNCAGVKSREQEFVQGTLVNATWYCVHNHSTCSPHTAEYNDGQLVRIDGREVTEFTPRMRSAPSWIQRLLDERDYPEYDNWNMEQVIFGLFQSEFSDLSVRINERIYDKSLATGRRSDSHLANAPLRVGIVLFLRENDLVCDYRFDELWITTQPDAENWSDKTGMDELSVAGQPRIAEALNQETAVEFATAADVRNGFGELVRFNCPIECVPPSQAASRTIHTVEMPKRHWLHQFLGRNDLKCELQGNHLLITPQN